MRRIDRDALRRAIELARAESPETRQQIDAKLKTEPWEEIAGFAAYSCQCTRLRLKPWEAPPVHSDDEVTRPDRYGSRPQEVALRQRMIKLGVSVYEPDPIPAIEAAEAERAACSPIERGSRWPKHKGPHRAHARRSD